MGNYWKQWWLAHTVDTILRLQDNPIEAASMIGHEAAIAYINSLSEPSTLRRIASKGLTSQEIQSITDYLLNYTNLASRPEIDISLVSSTIYEESFAAAIERLHDLGLFWQD